MCLFEFFKPSFKHYAKLTILDLKKEHHRCHPREREEFRIAGGS